MIAACQIRIYLSDKQKRLFDEHLACHRLLYNTVVAEAEALWEKEKKSKGTFSLVKEWVGYFRKNHKRFAACNYSSLQHTVRRFGKTRDAVITRRKRGERCSFRYKKEHAFNTIEYTYGDGLHTVGEKIKIHGLGLAKAVFHRKPENPSHVAVSRKGGEYYATFFCKTFGDVPAHDDGTAVGIDYGVRTLVTLSTGEKVESPRFAKRDKKDLARAHRALHKAAKGSRERARRRKILAKIYQRSANRRRNFAHQLSRKIVDRFSTICSENLEVCKIVSKDDIGAKRANINKAVYDVGIAMLQSFLAYKAENAGKRFVLVEPAYTSQTCSACGSVEAKTLDCRVHQCRCGAVLDRDTNAALNILTLGLQSTVKPRG